MKLVKLVFEWILIIGGIFILLCATFFVFGFLFVFFGNIGSYGWEFGEKMLNAWGILNSWV